jgi:hypothetical protein
MRHTDAGHIDGYDPACEACNAQDGAHSKRAMQMICAIMSGTRPDKLGAVDKVVNAWVFHPDKLTPAAMVEDLPVAEGTN